MPPFLPLPKKETTMSNSPIILNSVGGTFWTLAPGFKSDLECSVKIFSRIGHRAGAEIFESVPGIAIKYCNGYVKVSVLLSASPVPLRPADGDVIDVVITITNDGNTIVSGDVVIIDDPNPFVPPKARE